MTAVATALVLLGTLFSLLAAIGVLRFPDVYTRLHAASKAGPLGAGLVLVGVGVASGDWSVWIRVAVGLVFLLVTAPVSAHLLARAALKSGVEPVAGTAREDLEEDA
ncbi:MAG: monovalent cation/H(+) antiporter subunit G [Devosia sp.]